MKLIILTPSNRDPKWPHVESVKEMENHIRANGVRGRPVESITCASLRMASLLPQGRQQLHDLSLSLGNAALPPNKANSGALVNNMLYTHALWLDDDIEVFPQMMDYMADHLSLVHFNGSPVSRPAIVAANYVRKHARCEYTAVRDGLAVSSDPPNRSLQEVDTCAMGCMLIHLPSVVHIKPPHFEVLWDRKRGEYRSEDRYFCDKMRNAGVKIYIDHDVSRMVTHWGDAGYGYVMRQQNKITVPCL